MLSIPVIIFHIVEHLWPLSEPTPTRLLHIFNDISADYVASHVAIESVVVVPII